MTFYAVANGRNIGIFSNWTECKQSIDHYPKAIFKKFDTKEEAELFIEMYNSSKSEAESELPEYYVYTDGSCINNGKENAISGIGIYFGPNDIRNVSKRIEGKQSNNMAELTAIIETYYIIEQDILNGKRIGIVTDSNYAILCLTTYGEKMQKNHWKKDIPNREMVKRLYELYKDKPNVKFIHIMSHTNNKDIHSVGNENADILANMAVLEN